MPHRIGKPNRSNATGNVGASTLGGAIFGGSLTPAAAVSTLVLRENGSSGNVICSLQAAANGQSVPIPPMDYSGQLHATLTGASAEYTILL